MLLLVLVALPAGAIGACSTVVGAASIPEPGGFWSGAPAILMGLVFLAGFAATVKGARSLWR